MTTAVAGADPQVVGPYLARVLSDARWAQCSVTLIAGFRSADLLFWTGDDERVAALQREFGDLLEVVYTTNDGTFGVEGFVTTPLEDMLETAAAGTGPGIAEVVAIGPPLMMRAGRFMPLTR